MIALFLCKPGHIARQSDCVKNTPCHAYRGVAIGVHWAMTAIAIKGARYVIIEGHGVVTGERHFDVHGGGLRNLHDRTDCKADKQYGNQYF